MPEIQAVLNGRFKDENVQAVGISTGDSAAELRDFRTQEGVIFPFLMANPSLPNPYYLEVFETWELSVLYPTLVILDSEGIIRFRASGLQGTDEDEVDLRGVFDLIDTLLQEAKGAQEG